MLKRIAWSKDYEIVSSIDEQHKQILVLIVDLQGALETHDRSQILEWLCYLMEYSEGHMLYEEALMLQTKYLDVVNHIGLHHHIMANLRSNYQKILDSQMDVDELLSELDNWGRAHIQVEDMAFKEHFLSNKIK